jgi:imidazolonepropionase-like amidohydrolase
MSPALYGALIDEAHRNNIRVAVHATELEDAKGLLRAGIDVFAHMIDDVDDELVELFKQHPGTVVLPTLAAPRLATTYAPWLDPLDPLLAVTQSSDHIKQLRDRLAATRPDARRRADEAWEKLARGLKRLKAAGVRLGLGTDGGGQNGGYVGWTAHAELENLVAAGLTPMETLVLATRTTAEILRIDELGTVSRGKSADFVVLDANPLDNITNSRRISRVYLRGHEVDRARLAAAWKSGAATN